MHRTSKIMFFIALSGSLLCAQVKPAQPHKSSRLKRPGTAAKPAIEQAEPTPEHPVVPLSPEQQPSIPPKVTYSDGELTVIAQNSTMAEILSGIRMSTGLRIEAQGGPSGDRVAARIGPAPVRDVLVSLLDGSRFDYIILGSAENPTLVDRVILTPKTGGVGNPPSMATAQVGRPQQQHQQESMNPDNSGDGDEENSEGFAEPNPIPAEQAQPPQQMGQPNVQQPNTGQPQQPQDQQVKTPEQLMQELREMEQNRRNQNQDPNARPDRDERPK